MTRDRAKYLLANRQIGGDFKSAHLRPGDMRDKQLHPDGITVEEHEEIVSVWLTMEGWTTFTDAVIRIAQHGEEAVA